MNDVLTSSMPPTVSMQDRCVYILESRIRSKKDSPDILQRPIEETRNRTFDQCSWLCQESLCQQMQSSLKSLMTPVVAWLAG